MIPATVRQSAATWLAAGFAPKKVADFLGVSPVTVERWLQEPEFAAYVENLAANYDAALIDTLRAGARQAAFTLMDCLQANKESGTPDWRVRLEAAMTLLDRNGVPGRPVERAAKVRFNIEGSDVAEAVKKALAEPKIRQLVVESGKLALPGGQVLDVSDVVKDVEYEVEQRDLDSVAESVRAKRLEEMESVRRSYKETTESYDEDNAL